MVKGEIDINYKWKTPTVKDLLNVEVKMRSEGVYLHDTFIDDCYKRIIIPQIKKQCRKIDIKIFEYIAKEIKKNGSIVKRYGNWANFINKHFTIQYVRGNFYNKKLYFDKQLIGEY